MTFWTAGDFRGRRDGDFWHPPRVRLKVERLGPVTDKLAGKVIHRPIYRAQTLYSNSSIVITDL